jgi:hypothetical protein
MSGIKLVFDEAINYGALAYILVPYEHDFELQSVLSVRRVTELLIHFRAHLCLNEL